MLTDKLESMDQGDQLTNLRRAIAYRGLAMVPRHPQSFLPDHSREYLFHSLEMSQNLVPTSELEAIVFQENLYTTYQTLAKWEMAHQNNEGAEECLRKMIQIDPHDSTGFSELGLFLFQRERYAEAARFFETAVLLGPPAVGMSLYYQGLCRLEIGPGTDAVDLWQKSICFDPDAVSPWLEILEWLLKSNQREQARTTAKTILDNPNLREQLEQYEFEKLSSITDHSGVE